MENIIKWPSIYPIVFHKRSPSFSLGIAKLKFGLLPRYLSEKLYHQNNNRSIYGGA
jgi:hypothetical protein